MAADVQDAVFLVYILEELFTTCYLFADAFES